MAIKSTVFKFKLNVTDLDRHVYQEFPLSVARHPSETDERMMLRVAAFAMHADDALAFGKGLSNDDEPDLWLKDLTGNILLWIELGVPDPDRLRKACGRAERVALLAYGERSMSVWWDKQREALSRFNNLSILQVSDADYSALGDFAQSGASLQCTLSGDELWLTDGDRTAEIKLDYLMRAD